MIANYLKAINDIDENTRRKAIIYLSKSGSLKAIPALRNAAQYDESLKNRFYAKKGLFLIQQWIEKQTPDLTINLGFDKNNFTKRIDKVQFKKYLFSKNTDKKLQAINAAVKFNDNSLIPIMIDHLKKEKDKKIIRTTIISIAMIAKNEVFSIICEYLKNKDENIICSALDALEYIDNYEKFEVIIPLIISKNPLIRSKVFKIIKKNEVYNLIPICRKIMDSKLENKDSILFLMERFIVPEFKDIFLYMIKNNISKRSLSSFRNSFSEINDIIAKNNNININEELKNNDFDTDPYIEVNNDLGILDDDSYDDEADDYLIELDKMTEDIIFSSDENEIKNDIDIKKKQLEDKFQIINDAVRYNKTSKISYLIQELKGTNDPILKASLLIAIGKLGNSVITDSIINYIYDEDARVRANTVEALKIIGCNKYIKKLEFLLKDENNRVRANTIITLKNSYNVYPYLKEMLEDSSELMKKSAIYAIVDINEDKYLELLKIPLESKENNIRQKTISSLKMFCDQGNSYAYSLLMSSEKNYNDLLEYLKAKEKLFNKTLDDYEKDLLSDDIILKKAALMKFSNSKNILKYIDKIKEMCNDNNSVISKLAKQIIRKFK